MQSLLTNLRRREEEDKEKKRTGGGWNRCRACSRTCAGERRRTKKKNKIEPVGDGMPYMYALYVCLVCMPHMYALYVCLTCLPYMYALYVYLVCMPPMQSMLTNLRRRAGVSAVPEYL